MRMAEVTTVLQKLKPAVGLPILVALLLLLAWLASRGIANLALRYDEIWSMRYAGGAQFGPIPLADTVLRVLEHLDIERNPPGYYMLLNAWGNLVGWSEFSVRSLSVLG